MALKRNHQLTVQDCGRSGNGVFPYLRRSPPEGAPSTGIRHPRRPALSVWLGYFDKGGKASGQPVLVTGGAGYIGSHACKALAQAGFLPVAFDNLSTGWAEAVKYGPWCRAT